MSTTIKASQVVDSTGTSVESILNNFGDVDSQTVKVESTYFKNGQIITPTASIAANGTISVTVTFDTPFPNSCKYFNAICKPHATADFVGVNSIVSMTKTAVIFTIKNGATAQVVDSIYWNAIGD